MADKKSFFKGLDRSRRYHLAKDLPLSKIAVATPRTSTDIIENLNPDEAAVIPYLRVPHGYREGPEARETFPMFLKRGPTVVIPAPQSKEEAKLDDVGPTRKRLEAYQTLDDDAIAAGLSWYCTRDKKHRKVSLNTVMEGLQLYAFAHSQAKPSRVLCVHEYGVDRENRENGATSAVKVLSRSSDNMYTVALEHFPFIGSLETWVWPFLLSHHSDCGAKDYGGIYWQRDQRDGKRRKQHDEVFCPHDVAAYLAVSDAETKRVRRETPSARRVIPLQPFPLFTQYTVDFWNKLRTQTFFGGSSCLRGR